MENFGIPEMIVSLAALIGSTVLAITGTIDSIGVTNIYILVLGYVFGSVTRNTVRNKP